MAKNSSLNRALVAKEDEFYTQLPAIENELKHYRRHFKDKTVLCNCDDPFESNFFRYFALNFNRLGLKKLIATCYSGSSITGTQLSLFGDDEEERRTPYKAIVSSVRDANGDGSTNMLDIAELFRMGENSIERLEGDGDFRSEECLELLDEADIVCSNPPFSLFREYVATLIEHDKKFVIIGSRNAITYKEIFPLLMENKMWLGYGFNRGDAYFKIPKERVRDFAPGVYDEKTGLVHFRNCAWYSNLDIKKRHESLILVRKYNPDDYPRYSNFDAIEVSKTGDIPCDYDGLMGVPITFMDKYSPEQFEIVGISSSLARPIKDCVEPDAEYAKGGPRFYIPVGPKEYKRCYDRIVVKNRRPEEA